MKYTIEIGSIWEFGERKDENGNPHQEDSLFPAYGEQKETDRVFVLCDGMGGHAAGEVASKTVCDAMSSLLITKVKENSFRLTDSDVNDAVDAAFDALDAIDNNSSGKSKMGTTMTFLALHDEGATLAHMGDSRIYHLRPGKDGKDTQILFQTRDHSLVNDLVAIGKITPEEAKTHPRRNVITKAMQPHIERPDADVHHITDIRDDDWFFLCSDGMLEQMEDFGLRYFFSHEAGDMSAKIDALRTATEENRDNHTAILIHVLKVEGGIVHKTAEDKKKSKLMGIVSEDSDPNIGQLSANNYSPDIQADRSTLVNFSDDGTSKHNTIKHYINLLKRKWVLRALSLVLLFAAAVLLAKPVSTIVKKHTDCKHEQKKDVRTNSGKRDNPQQKIQSEKKGNDKKEDKVTENKKTTLTKQTEESEKNNESNTNVDKKPKEQSTEDSEKNKEGQMNSKKKNILNKPLTKSDSIAK